MRMHGYCIRCHRVRMVRVLMSRWTGRGVPQGICAECEEKEHG